MILHLNRCSARTPAPLFVPSPLVGEGSTVSKPELARERGCPTLRPFLWHPLSRLERFAFDPPSPTRGEGTIASGSERTSA